MFLSRLFRRRQSGQPQQRSPPSTPQPSGQIHIEIISEAPPRPRQPTDEPPPESTNSSSSSNSPQQSLSVAQEAHARSVDNQRDLVRLLSSPLHGQRDRVQAMTRLLDALRRLEAEREVAGPTRERPLSLFIALALHELDAIVDSLSYEELWEAFGGHALPLGLHDAAIKAIPVRQLTAAEADAMHDSACPVCLEPFCAAQAAKALPTCTHTFHAGCIDTWISAKADCPVCRQKVMVAVGEAPAALS